jgi:hypothetical protein
MNGYGLSLTLEYDTDPAYNTTIDWDKGAKKATYSFPEQDFTSPNYADQGYSILLAAHGNQDRDIAPDDWFYAARVQNFKGFGEPNRLSWFEFSMISRVGGEADVQNVLPELLVSAEWVDGLYKGEKKKALLLSAEARRYVDQSTGGEPEVIWKSEVGGAHPAVEIPGITPGGDTVLDIGVKVERDDANSRSLATLYYRLDNSAGDMRYGGSWTPFAEIPVPYKTAGGETIRFPGLPVIHGGFAIHSEEIALPVTVENGGGTITVNNEAIDKTELAAVGVPNAEPISTKESFELSGVNPGSTALFRYGLSGKALPDSNSKRIPLRNVEMKKIFSDDQKSPINFTYTQVLDPSNLADGQWCLFWEGNISIPLTPNSFFDNSTNYFVYFAIEDGGEFDLDGSADGTIRDPNILVLPDSSGSGGNPGPGLAAVPIPAREEVLTPVRATTLTPVLAAAPTQARTVLIPALAATAIPTHRLTTRRTHCRILR